MGAYGSHMKTTVDLPDNLLIAAKTRAAETRTTLRAILERGLRRAIRWVTAKGGLPPGLNVANRAEMHEWLSREL